MLKLDLSCETPIQSSIIDRNVIIAHRADLSHYLGSKKINQADIREIRQDSRKSFEEDLEGHKLIIAYQHIWACQIIRSR